MKKLGRYTSAQSLVWELTAYSTWSDHSVLRMLAGSCEEAIKLLDEFDSRVDPFLPINCYAKSLYLYSNMVPAENSAYTLLAVSLANCPDQPSLQFVYNIRSLLMDKCDITQHCFQLLPVRNPTVIYWIIPKCVTNTVNTIIAGNYEYLKENELMEVAVYEHSGVMFDDVTENQPMFPIRVSDTYLYRQHAYKCNPSKIYGKP